MYYFQRGIAHGELGNYDAAIADYTKAIEISPNLSQAYNNRGNAYDDLKNYDAAISDFTKAIEINPNLSVAYGNRELARKKKREAEQSRSTTSKVTDSKQGKRRSHSRRIDTLDIPFGYYHASDNGLVWDDDGECIRGGYYDRDFDF